MITQNEYQTLGLPSSYPAQESELATWGFESHVGGDRLERGGTHFRNRSVPSALVAGSSALLLGSGAAIPTLGCTSTLHRGPPRSSKELGGKTQRPASMMRA